MFENETGAQISGETGEHIHEGSLDFDVWAYLRPGSGHTVTVRQVPPQPALEAAEDATLPDVWWTVNVAQGMTTFQGCAEVEADAQRISFDDLPDDVQATVFANAGSGWVWNGVEHHFDPAADEWMPSS